MELAAYGKSIGQRSNQPTIIVTGASRGLGAATAQVAAELGARVLLTARSANRLQDITRKIGATGGIARVVIGDITRVGDCRAIISQALDQFGRIDALVNNAGMVEPIAPIAEARYQAWMTNWAINVAGPVMLTQMALPALRQNRGRVINITSGTADTVVAGWGAYSSAKAALNHLTKILASEEPGITAIAIHPGIMDTKMQATIREKGKGQMAGRNYEWLSRLHETGKFIQPELPGRVVACLALYAPQEWSGEILLWNEPKVQKLVLSKMQPGKQFP